MKAPYFWSADLDPRSREAAPLTRFLLTPVSMIYLWALRRKLARAQPQTAPVPVICIGNLTAGGAGKTPVTEAIRNRINSAGLRAASLSRLAFRRLDLLDPEIMVLLRPVLVDLPARHRVDRPLHANRADVDMREHHADQE